MTVTSIPVTVGYLFGRKVLGLNPVLLLGAITGSMTSGASLSIVNAEVTSHGDGLFTVSAEIENSGYFPTSLQHGVVSRAVQPTTVQIQVPTDAVLTGSAKTSTIQRLDGSGNRERFSWVIRGQAGTSIEIRVRSQKGGSDTATVTVR